MNTEKLKSVAGNLSFIILKILNSVTLDDDILNTSLRKSHTARNATFHVKFCRKSTVNTVSVIYVLYLLKTSKHI